MPLTTIKSSNIKDSEIKNADISPTASITESKIAGLDASQITANAFNIGVLGFKMAVNDGLTVFNLVDGVVDEFHDESGTDEAEGSNDTYCASSDFYTNTQCTPTPFSAGFSPTAITEPDTSTAGTNPTVGSGTFGAFTVPTGTTSVDIKVWGAAGGSTYLGDGGGGGYAEGTLAVTGGQSLAVVAGEGGSRGTCGVADSPPAFRTHGGLGGGGPGSAGGAGLAGVFVAPATTEPASGPRGRDSPPGFSQTPPVQTFRWIPAQSGSARRRPIRKCEKITAAWPSCRPACSRTTPSTRPRTARIISFPGSAPAIPKTTLARTDSSTRAPSTAAPVRF